MSRIFFRFLNSLKYNLRMKYILKTKKLFKIFVLSIPIISIMVLFVLSTIGIILIHKFNIICPFNLLTGHFCPGCGSTRSISAILELNFLLSLRNNPLYIFLIFFSVIAYIELLTFTFFNHKKLIPRKNSFYYKLTFLFLLYYLIRNFIPVLMPI